MEGRLLRRGLIHPFALNERAHQQSIAKISEMPFETPSTLSSAPVKSCGERGDIPAVQSTGFVISAADVAGKVL
jgi:hypothetical protein